MSDRDRRTQVGIVGAGPAGLLLGHLLRAEGIEVVVVERQSPAHVLSRIRAGVLESVTTDLLRRLGLDARLNAEGLAHHGFTFSNSGRAIRIDIAGLTGRQVVVYGQTEVTRDLIDAAPERGLEIEWSSPVTAIERLAGPDPVIVHGDGARLTCDFVVACDGFHGVGRASLPTEVRRVFERAYPFGWLGLLADVPPCDDELIYASHARGFALASMRSPTRSRYYVQVGLNERVEDWSENRFFDELGVRLGDAPGKPITRGPALEMSIAPLRSMVTEPMQYGRLFLAGDAAHIVPPTGAKGLNLASSDVTYLAEALTTWFKRGVDADLAGYGARALARVWKAERFSWYLTKLTHQFPEDGDFERRMQTAELDYIAESSAMQTAIAENYVGLPL